MSQAERIQKALALLDLHYGAFHAVVPAAVETGHPVPMDTRGWSQIIVSTLCEVRGIERKKGADLDDGSDVKGANTWYAIDTPRFNGCIKAGTKATTAGNMSCLDEMPFLYFVLWDETKHGTARCRIWVVRPHEDPSFRTMCQRWYELRDAGEIVSNNFQLHPPRGLDSNIIRNTCGNLEYPLWFSAERTPSEPYQCLEFDENARLSGVCREI